MCGIAGWKWDGTTNPAQAKLFIESLLVRSQMRGCHATGVCWADHGLRLLKAPLPAEQFIETPGWADLKLPVAAIAHTRYSTSGDWTNNENNQPLIVGDLALVHNGLVSMATKPEFEQAYGVRCATENDSEIILRKIQRLRKAGRTLTEAAKIALEEVNAVETPIFALGLLTDAGQMIHLRDGVRPLHKWRVPQLGLSGFCSTEDIFERALEDAGVEKPLTRINYHAAFTIPDLDYREHRREGFIHYYRAMMLAGDIDPAFPTMTELIRRYQLSREQQFWLAFIYTIFYHNATTFLFMQEFPEIEKVDLARLDRWLAKHEGTLLFQKDRRWNRWKVSAMVADYIRVLGGKTQQEFFAQFLSGVGDPQQTFVNIWDWMMKDGVFNVGRHSAVAWIETLMRCLDYPVEPDSRVMLAAGSSLQGLELATGSRSLDDAADLMSEIEHRWSYVPVDWFYFETVCCAWKGFFKGNRYLGYYLDRMAAEIVAGEQKMRAVSEGVNWKTLWEIRSEVFPHRYLGELQPEPWTEIQKHKLGRFEETGRI